MQNCVVITVLCIVNGSVQQKEIQVSKQHMFFSLNTAKATVRRTSIHDLTSGEHVLVESILRSREPLSEKYLCAYLHVHLGCKAHGDDCDDMR